MLFGWWLAALHLITAFAQAITIIGLPLAAANAKLAPAALWPFGREIVATADVTAALAQYRAQGVEVIAVEAQSTPAQLPPPPTR